MAKKTVLQFVQEIGDAITSDEIDTLDESVEATSIATILKQTYEEVISRKSWKFLKGRVRVFDARTSTLKCNLLIPADVTRLECVKYKDTNGKPQELTFLEPCDFVDKLMQRNPLLDNVETITNADGVDLYIANDTPPRYYTSFDEVEVTLDAYETTKSDGVVPQDSVIIATVIPVVDFTDPGATLPVPERMDTLILNESIATANYRLRQTADPRSERLARRQNISLRENEPKTRDEDREVTYGRRQASGR